jgi:hypothetical protein
MSKYGKCDEGFPILEDFVCQAIPGSPNVAGIKVGIAFVTDVDAWAQFWR